MNWKPKPKKCKECGKKFLPYNPLQIVCEWACAIEYNRKKAIKDKVETFKKNLKSLTDYEKEAKKEFQLYIRKRDEKQNCISCGIVFSELWDGSHYFPAGQYSGLIFDEDNCHKACGKCNRFLHGSLIGYRLGLVKRYGVMFVDELESRSDKNRNYKYTKAELIEIKNKYKELNKKLNTTNN